MDSEINRWGYAEERVTILSDQIKILSNEIKRLESEIKLREKEKTRICKKYNLRIKNQNILKRLCRRSY